MCLRPVLYQIESSKSNFRLSETVQNGHAAPSLCAKLYVGTPRFFTTHRISTIVRTRLWHDESAKRLNRIEHVAVEVLNPWCESSHVLHHRLG